MAKPDWLSIEEITRLWSEETGLDASAFRQDLEAWFAEFVKQTPASQPLIRGGTADSTNRLMGLLGARYLERSIFLAYCEERGHPKPRFWFGARDDESWRDRPRQSGPAPSSPDATPSRPDDPPARDSAEGDPESVAFQAKIAGLSERLETSETDIPGFTKPEAASRRRGEAGRRRTGPAAEQTEHQPSAQAAASTAEVSELKAQLEAAEQRIADLTAQSQATHGSAAPRSSAPGSPPPDVPGQAPATHRGRDLPSTASYRDPGASGQLLRRAAARRRTGAKVAATAGMAILVVATLLWGAKTAIQLADNPAMPPPGETADATDGRSPADGGAPPAPSTLATSAGHGQADSDTPPVASSDGKLGTEGRDLTPPTAPAESGSADPQAAGMDLTAAQQQIAHLRAAVDASDAMVARLQDELAIARRRAEATLQSSPEKTADDTRKQRLAAQALSAEVAIARRQLEDVRRQAEGNAEAQAQRRELMSSVTALSARVDSLKRSLEANRQQTAGLTSDLETAKAEVTRLRAALKRTEEQAAEANSARYAAATAAAQARTTLGRTKDELASLGKQLEAARGSIAEANESAAQARAETTRLRQESTRLTDELAKVTADASNLREALERSESGRQELTLAATAASARVAALQRELEAAYLQVDMLDKARKATEEEALRLRETLATPPSDPGRAPSAESDTAKPENAASPAAAESAPRSATISVIGPAAPDGDRSGGFGPVPETDAGVASDLLASTEPQAAATSSLDPAEYGLEQVAALGSTDAALQSDAVPDTVAADDLLLEPGNHIGREVVVTGSIVWQLWRYRLQSTSGKSSMVIDLKGLRPDERTELSNAINKAGSLGEVRARIRGTVERQGAEGYRLAASELVMIQ